MMKQHLDTTREISSQGLFFIMETNHSLWEDSAVGFPLLCWMPSPYMQRRLEKQVVGISNLSTGRQRNYGQVQRWLVKRQARASDVVHIFLTSKKCYSPITHLFLLESLVVALEIQYLILPLMFNIVKQNILKFSSSPSFISFFLRVPFMWFLFLFCSVLCGLSHPC